MDNSIFLSLEEKLKFLLVSMKFLGIFHEKPSLSNIGDDLQKSSERQTRNHGFKAFLQLLFSSRTYSFLVCVLLTFNVVRYIPAFWIGEYPVQNMTTFRVITFSWFIQSAINGFILFVSFEKKDRYLDMKHHLNSVTADDRMICSSHYKVKRLTCFVTCFAWVLFILEATFILYLVCSNISLEYRIGVINPFPDWTAVRVATSLISLYNNAVWCFTTAYVMSVCFCFKYEFDDLNERLGKLFKEEGSTAVHYLESFRLKHRHICEGVEIAEKDMKYLFGNCYVTNMFMCCFIVYHLIRSSDISTIQLTVEISWTVFSILSVILMSMGAALVNEAAHSPLEHIYHIDVSEANPQQLGQLNLFLSKLTGTSIGFSFIGMVTVTKEVILTLAGLFITYLFLLLQFRI